MDDGKSYFLPQIYQGTNAGHVTVAPTPQEELKSERVDEVRQTDRFVSAA